MNKIKLCVFTKLLKTVKYVLFIDHNSQGKIICFKMCLNKVLVDSRLQQRRAAFQERGRGTSCLYMSILKLQVNRHQIHQCLCLNVAST